MSKSISCLAESQYNFELILIIVLRFEKNHTLSLHVYHAVKSVLHVGLYIGCFLQLQKKLYQHYLFIYPNICI